MFVEFESLPENARVWFYQSERNLTAQEKQITESKLKDAINGWVTHGSPMKGSFKIIDNRIILIAADTDFQDPSGCSIDSSTRWLKALGEDLVISFFDRSIAYYNGEQLQFFPFFEAKKLVTNGTIKPDTQLVNHQLASIEDFNKAFTLKASDSFLKRHFNLAEIS